MGRERFATLDLRGASSDSGRHACRCAHAQGDVCARLGARECMHAARECMRAIGQGSLMLGVCALCGTREHLAARYALTEEAHEAALYREAGATEDGIEYLADHSAPGLKSSVHTCAGMRVHTLARASRIPRVNAHLSSHIHTHTHRRTHTHTHTHTHAHTHTHTPFVAQCATYPPTKLYIDHTTYQTLLRPHLSCTCREGERERERETTPNISLARAGRIYGAADIWPNSSQIAKMVVRVLKGLERRRRRRWRRMRWWWRWRRRMWWWWWWWWWWLG